MSKKMVNILKNGIKKLKYEDLKAKRAARKDWNEISSGYLTYIDLVRTPKLTINGQVIANEFIKELFSKHGNLISEGYDRQKNHRPFLKQVFIEIFKSANATVPNDSILEELITNYNQAGYMGFSSCVDKALLQIDLISCSPVQAVHHIICDEPDCLKFSFSHGTKDIHDHRNDLIFTSNLFISVEYKLKCKDGNVTYENGKVLLTIAKELENYKVSGKNLFNVTVEYFQKFCEKLGFKFETKVEHSLDEPLKVLNDANSQNARSRLPVIAASMLAITGVVTGIAIYSLLRELAVGIAVGACCLVAAVIIYYCNKPSKSLENSNAEAAVSQRQSYNSR